MGYETEKWREPTIQKDDTVIYSEHGRVVNNTCFRSHWVVLVKQQFGGYALLVKHGAGEERIQLGYDYHLTWVKALEGLDSDMRYLCLYTIYTAHSEAKREGAHNAANRYATAFLEGRLKRRKRNHRYYCEILPKIMSES